MYLFIIQYISHKIEALNRAGLVSRAFRHVSLHASLWQRHYSRLMHEMDAQQQHEKAMKMQRDKERKEKYPHLYHFIPEEDEQSALNEAKEVCDSAPKFCINNVRDGDIGMQVRWNPWQSYIELLTNN